MNHHQALRYQPGNPAAGNPPAKANSRACQHFLANVRTVLLGIDLQIRRQTRQPQRRQRPSDGDQLPPAPQAQITEVPHTAGAPGKGTECGIGGIHRKTGNLKNRRIRLRHGGTGYQETGSAPYDAAGPTHAQAVMQRTEKRKTGLGIKVVITDRHNRQTIPDGQAADNSVGKHRVPGGK